MLLTCYLLFYTAAVALAASGCLVPAVILGFLGLLLAARWELRWIAARSRPRAPQTHP